MFATDAESPLIRCLSITGFGVVITDTSVMLSLLLFLPLWSHIDPLCVGYSSCFCFVKDTRPLAASDSLTTL